MWRPGRLGGSPSQCYDARMTREHIDSVLERVRSWPQEDQEELAELVREIEARRTGVYVLNDEEREAIARTVCIRRGRASVLDAPRNCMRVRYRPQALGDIDEIGRYSRGFHETDQY